MAQDTTNRSSRQGLLGFDYDYRGQREDVTARAGLPLVLETARALGLDSNARELLRIRKRASGYTEAEHVEALLLLQASGGERMEDMAHLAADKGLVRLTGKKTLPSPDAVGNFLKAFHDDACIAEAEAALLPKARARLIPESKPLLALAEVGSRLVRRIHAAAAALRTTATIEHDNTIVESTKREARAHYKGGRGYQPGIAYWSEMDLIVADEFREGNVPAAMRPLHLIRRAFANLPTTVTTRRFRADSACYGTETLKWLADPENRIDRFTISADMSRELALACAALPEKAWKPYEERVTEVVTWAEVEFCSGNWPKDAKPLRTLVKRVVKRQGALFPDGNHQRHFAVVSNDWTMNGKALLDWHYQRAGQIEHVHDVLKNELGAGTLPCAEFGANAAWFRLSTFVYNLLSALKTLALPADLQDARPKRLRFAVLTLPGRLIMHARKLTVRLAEAFRATVDLIAVRGILQALAPPPPA